MWPITRIRCLRPVLIEDTVNFEQRFFCKRIQAGRFDTSKAAAWYIDSQRLSTSDAYQRELGRCLSFSRPSQAAAALDHPVGEVSTYVFVRRGTHRQAARRRARQTSALRFACESMRSCRAFRKPCPTSTVGLLSRRGSARSSRSSADFGVHTPASTRPSSFVHSNRGSMTSSPRNSGLFGYQPALAAGPRAEALYESFLDLVNTAPPTSGRPRKSFFNINFSLNSSIMN